MATDPRRLLASQIPPQFNTGIVPVQRAQPSVNDGGEAARLAAARVSQMAPPTLDRTQIVPTGTGAPQVMQTMRTMSGPVATGVTAPIQEENRNYGLDRAMQAMGPERAAQFQQMMANIDARRAQAMAQRPEQSQYRRRSRAERIAEIMANRRPVMNKGLLAQGAPAGFAPGAPYPLPPRG